ISEGSTRARPRRSPSTKSPMRSASRRAGSTPCTSSLRSGTPWTRTSISRRRSPPKPPARSTPIVSPSADGRTPCGALDGIVPPPDLLTERGARRPFWSRRTACLGSTVRRPSDTGPPRWVLGVQRKELAREPREHPIGENFAASGTFSRRFRDLSACNQQSTPFRCTRRPQHDDATLHPAPPPRTRPPAIAERPARRSRLVDGSSRLRRRSDPRLPRHRDLHRRGVRPTAHDPSELRGLPAHARQAGVLRGGRDL